MGKYIQKNKNKVFRFLFLQELKEAKDKITAIMEEPETSGPGRPRSYYEQKIKLLEAETNDLRKKLVDKERQLERISSEMDIAKRKGGTLNRSKSLDDYQLVDLRRQLQMAEQEIVLLRQKVTALESDNDKLSADYKRLQFKVREIFFLYLGRNWEKNKIFCF